MRFFVAIFFVLASLPVSATDPKEGYLELYEACKQELNQDTTHKAGYCSGLIDGFALSVQAILSDTVRAGLKTDVYGVLASYIDPIFEELIILPLKKHFYENLHDGAMKLRQYRLEGLDFVETQEKIESLSELYCKCGIKGGDTPRFSELVRSTGFDFIVQLTSQYYTITKNLSLQSNSLLIGSPNIFDFFEAIASTTINHQGNRQNREKFAGKHKRYQLLCLDLRNTSQDERKAFGFHGTDGSRDDRRNIIYRYCKYCSEHTQAYECFYKDCNSNQNDDNLGDLFSRLDKFNNYLNLAMNKLNQTKQYDKYQREFCSLHVSDKARRIANADFKKGNAESFLNYPKDLMNRTMYAHVQNLYLADRNGEIERYHNPENHFELIKRSRRMAEKYLLSGKHQKFFDMPVLYANIELVKRVASWLAGDVKIEVTGA